MFDETYELFVYDGNEHASAIRWFEKHPETVIIVNSMSKTFAMTGWRLGYAIAHPEIIAALGKIQSHSTSNPTSISQYAAIEAFAGRQDSVREMLDEYRKRRDWLVPALNEIPGVSCLMPEGAFYAFANVKGALDARTPTSRALADRLLEEVAVAVTPGSSFGAEGYLRLSYATSLADLQRAVERMRTVLG
jgi:aspartate aminotransferase